MKEIILTIKHEVGLHARPAAEFVKLAKKFESKIVLTNLTHDSKPTDAKSILGVLQAAVAKNNQIHLQAEGVDAEVAIAALAELVENNFGE
ncbi:MAG: HPr family phosphocarrier protein [Anaerolineae bacterium]|nr:HPr family phosphocarrier protein [Anaerolineae bacterium]